VYYLGSSLPPLGCCSSTGPRDSLLPPPASTVSGVSSPFVRFVRSVRSWAQPASSVVFSDRAAVVTPSFSLPSTSWHPVDLTSSTIDLFSVSSCRLIASDPRSTLSRHFYPAVRRPAAFTFVSHKNPIALCRLKLLQLFLLLLLI